MCGSGSFGCGSRWQTGRSRRDESTVDCTLESSPIWNQSPVANIVHFREVARTTSEHPPVVDPARSNKARYLDVLHTGAHQTLNQFEFPPSTGPWLRFATHREVRPRKCERFCWFYLVIRDSIMHTGLIGSVFATHQRNHNRFLGMKSIFGLIKDHRLEGRRSPRRRLLRHGELASSGGRWRQALTAIIFPFDLKPLEALEALRCFRFLSHAGPDIGVDHVGVCCGLQWVLR